MIKLSHLISCILLLAGYSSVAQEKHCGTDQVMQQRMLSDRHVKAAVDKFRSSVRSFNFEGAKASKSVSSAADYTIPVVFHILHTNGAENISDFQVLDAVKILNLDFRKVNPDTVLIVPPFKSIAADSKIEFHLATKDPLGNCTNGILHHYDANTIWDGDFQEYVYTWDPTKYLNIYVVKVITFGAAGYTYLPGTVSGAEDAIVILQDYTGSIGTGSPSKSRALTHEVGHWLGLEHVWGWSNTPGVQCGDDGIPDTPITKGHQSCQLTSNACTPGVVENVQNYMEYAYCSNMFTSDQASVMQSVLDPFGYRDNLSSPSNLVATGVTNPSTCVPVSNFNSSNYAYEVCSGNSILFKDYSTNGAVTAYNWSATGSATVATPSASSTLVYFPSAGIYTVSLQVQNSAGSSSSSKTVNVLNGQQSGCRSYMDKIHGYRFQRIK
ncbi:MAG: hypothetical protein K0S12_1360 [Bacteroidetes bacterium]|nr:hypothetical protein [Bacteroidota bacterium]